MYKSNYLWEHRWKSLLFVCVISFICNRIWWGTIRSKKLVILSYHIWLVFSVHLLFLTSKKQDLQTETIFLKHRIGLQSRLYQQEVVKTIIFICCHSISLTEQPKQYINCFVSFFPPKRVFLIPTRCATGQHGL